MLVHDFPSDAVGKAIPYGVYDVTDNSGWVTVGTDHDTPTFAASTIDTWWIRMGAERYPAAKELFITAEFPGGVARERRLHELLRPLNLRGEWYRGDQPASFEFLQWAMHEEYLMWAEAERREMAVAA